jgi:transformation/transcription domain-associated protein
VKILNSVIIPCFAVAFDRNEGDQLIGVPANPYTEDDNNIVSVFINKVIDPDKSMDEDEDPLRIALLQFACLLVERSSAHIHDGGSSSKKEGSRLRRLMTFAWPCLLAKNYVDPAARYHGHLLLAHIIAKLAINKRIVLQVFHSLLKAHALEARNVVRQALEVLTPAMPLRMEDGNQMLTHWTKKIILEEGHSMQQLHHILQLIVRHYKVYFPVRHQLVQQMISSMNRLGFSPNGSIDYRKLAVELAEVIIKWELLRIKEENGETCDEIVLTTEKASTSGGVKRSIQDDETRKKQATGSETSGSSTPSLPQPRISDLRPLERSHCDAALNFLFKLACNLGDIQQQLSVPGMITPGETLSRRCVLLIKKVMDPEIWLNTCDLKLLWLDKVFSMTEQTQASVINICIALELLTFLLTVMRRDQLLAIFKPLQRGLSVCVTSTNPKIIKMMHTLLTKLMSIFTPDHKHDEMDNLYSTISKTIIDGLTSFEKNPKASPQSLFGTLMILKAACNNNQTYIDRLIIPFMHILDRLKKEHIGPSAQIQQPPQLQNPQAQQPAATHNNSEITLEMLIVSLDLVKNRVNVMTVDLRKMFIGTILVGLIEKSTEPKVIKAIIKIIEEWMKNRNSSMVNPAPNLREKSILLAKLMHYVEKRFSDDSELNAQFLELVNYIYRDDQLKVTELTSKLEQAFLAGLRCNQPSIRSKFFEVFDGSMRRKLHDRLLYIICSHSWDSIQHHYWIKQCIELLILTTNTTHSQIKNSSDSHMLPSITSVINLADSEEKNNFVIYTSLQPDQNELTVIEDKEDAIDMEMNVDTNISRREESERPVENRNAVLQKLINRQADFLDAARKVKTEQLLIATSQLCHMDTQLAESVWIQMFPRLWSILDDGQQQSLDRELVAFLSSGTHVVQKDCHPSALNTFVEALHHCDPPIYIPPSLMTYLGKAHNLWHRMTLMLEDTAMDWPNRRESALNTEYRSEYDFDVELQNEIATSSASGTRDNGVVMEPLSQMYSALCEEDLWAGLWQKYSKYPETNSAIFYEQMGYFEDAQHMYELCMTKFKQECVSGSISSEMNSEILLWENHWIRCTKELNEWNILLEYGQSNKDKHAFLIMDSAWRVPDWNLMKQALMKAEQTSPKQMGHKISLYKGYLTILNQDDPSHLPSVDKYVEISSALCMREWRRLPPIVSHIHLPILQSAQQIMELQEASQIHQTPLKVPDMKAVVKTWRNRLPAIADDLSHWSDIFTWRQHHYQIITDNIGNSDIGPNASAQTIIQFGKTARKQNLTNVCHNLLSRIHTIQAIPVVVCFQKIRHEVKCFIQMAQANQDQGALSEALEVIESTNIKYFKPELIAEIYCLKGILLNQMQRPEEANKAFSASVQLYDGLSKAWACWGDYLETSYTRDPSNTTNGLSAMICFIHACRQPHETKSRKYFSKIIWLLTYEESRKEMLDALEKYGQAIPPVQWLPWIPQLLNCLIQYEGEVIMNLLSSIARAYPQAVYFPIRTLYLMLKIEQRERYKSVEQAVAKNQANEQQSVSSGDAGTSSQGSQPQQTPQTIKATPPMYRCSKIMHMQRDIHPTTLSSLEGIVDQMVWFRENWYEEVLRQLRQGLAKCYAIAFDNRATVNEATITPHTLNFVRKLVSTFGIGIENITNNTNINAGSSASESLARRAQATVQDPVFQKLKGQFTSDFDFSQPDATKMQNLITKLKIWIKILDAKTKQLPK